MASIVEQIDVTVPVQTASNQWTQFEDFPRFMGGVRSVTQQTNTRTHWVIDIGGQTREFDADITEQVPDERVAWKSVDGTSHAGVVTFHRLDANRTRVTLQLETVPEGAVETLGDKLGLVKRRVNGDMERFQSFIEARGRETGSWRGEVPRP